MFVIIGWLCAVCGTALAVPQFLRIIRSGSTSGVSLLAWQLWCCIGVVWAVHGVVGGSVTMLIPNAFSAVFAGFIIGKIVLDRRVRLLDVLPGPLLLIGIAITLRLVLGPVAFSLFMLIPQAIAVLGQFHSLVRCIDLYGVSGFYLRASVVMQTLWLAYGIVGHDIACTISSIMMIVLVTMNVTVYTLRRRGRMHAHPTFADGLTSRFEHRSFPLPWRRTARIPEP